MNVVNLMPWWQWCLAGWALVVVAVMLLGTVAERHKQFSKQRERERRIRENYGEWR